MLCIRCGLIIAISYLLKFLEVAASLLAVARLAVVVYHTAELPCQILPFRFGLQWPTKGTYAVMPTRVLITFTTEISA